MKKGIIKILSVILIISAGIFCLTACDKTNENPIHQHTFLSEWTFDETRHWHIATCEHTDQVSGFSLHQWDNGTVTTAPTEFTDGVMTYTCIICQATKTEAVARIHICTFINKDTSEKFLAVEADCLNPARYFYSCSCGEKGSETFAYGSPSGHNYGTPTYTWSEDKCTATRICLNDSTHKETETVTGVYLKDTDATCLTPEKGHYKASFDNKAYTTQNTAENSVDNGTAKGHNFSDEWSISDTYHWKAATCGHNEVKDKAEHRYFNGICSVCGKKEGERVPLYTYTLNDFGGEIILNLYEDGTALMGVDQIMYWEKVDNLAIVSGGAVWLHIPFKIEQDGKTIIPYLAEEKTPLYVTHLSEGAFPNSDWKFLDNGKVVLICYVDGKIYQWYMLDYVKEGNILNVEGQIQFIINNDGSLSLYEEQEQTNENRRYYSFEEGVLSITGYIELRTNGTFEVKGLQPEFSGTYTEDNNDFAFRANIGGYDSQFTGTLVDDILTISIYNMNKVFKLSKNYEKHEHNYVSGVCSDCGYVYESNGLIFTLNGDGESYSLTWIGSYADKDVIIPETYQGKPVNSIGEYAFCYCERLTSIKIPNSVMSIGKRAFEHCSLLTSIEIPNSVVSIDDYAFCDCESLKNITMSNGIISIGSSAFYKCSSLVYNEYGNAYYLGNNENPYLILIKAKNTSIATCQINENTKVIGNSAFKYCNLLQNVTIGNSVKIIGDYAFGYCETLKSVTIGDGVTVIGKGAFSGCWWLTNITMGNNVIEIGDYAFYDCWLLSVVIPNSVTSIGDSAFEYCAKLVEVINLSELDITTTSYGLTALKVKTSGESEIINKNGYLLYTANNINYLLGYVDNATKLTLPESYNGQSYEIYQYAFLNYSLLTNVTIGDSVTSIGDYAFYGCSSLTSITIPESVTSIGDYAFYGCSLLTSITIPESVTSIGDCAFEYCAKLVEVINLSELDITTTSYGLTALKVKTSGESDIVNINGYLFYTKVGFYYYGANNFLLGYIGNDSELILPDNYNGENYVIYEYAFYGMNNITDVEFGENCKCVCIDRDAFTGCIRLTNITFGGKIEAWDAINKGYRWNDGVPATVVHCSDGDISI